MANKDYKKEKQEVLDDLILKAYMLGWTDCFGNDRSNEMLFKENSILEVAYNCGWSDFIAGDDISSVDSQTDKQILKNIKYIHKQRLKNLKKEGSYDK